MIEHNDGHVVTIASMAGHVVVAKLVGYCSSKAAACGFDEALRLELETRGIKGVRTSLICPYFIRSTGMFEEVNSRFVPQLKSNEVADRVIYIVPAAGDGRLTVLPHTLRVPPPPGGGSKRASTLNWGGSCSRRQRGTVTLHALHAQHSHTRSCT